MAIGVELYTILGTSVSVQQYIVLIFVPRVAVFRRGKIYIY